MIVSDIYELNEGLKVLADKELPIKTALLVKRNITELESELTDVEALRREIVDKYKEETSDEMAKQGKVLIKEEYVEKFNADIFELMNQVAEFKVRKIDIEELSDISIKPTTLHQLRFIFKD